ncbi:MAG: hypothetical protein LBG52_08195 [Candidatus Peribacteria bacterium]|nr:hypothetical protein [Candidatus Peribacteria bacterium]
MISDYPLTVTQTKTLLKIYNDLIDKEVWMKRTYISEYHLLITLVEQ